MTMTAPAVLLQSGMTSPTPRLTGIWSDRSQAMAFGDSTKPETSVRRDWRFRHQSIEPMVPEHGMPRGLAWGRDFMQLASNGGCNIWSVHGLVALLGRDDRSCFLIDDPFVQRIDIERRRNEVYYRRISHQS